jgi:hypothetical protein
LPTPAEPASTTAPRLPSASQANATSSPRPTRGQVRKTADAGPAVGWPALAFPREPRDDAVMSTSPSVPGPARAGRVRVPGDARSSHATRACGGRAGPRAAVGGRVPTRQDRSMAVSRPRHRRHSGSRCARGMIERGESFALPARIPPNATRRGHLCPPCGDTVCGARAEGIGSGVPISGPVGRVGLGSVPSWLGDRRAAFHPAPVGRRARRPW